MLQRTALCYQLALEKWNKDEIVIEASISLDWPTFISKVMTSQKLNLWNYGVDKHISRKKKMKNVQLLESACLCKLAARYI